MDILIKKISNILSLILIFVFSAVFYFNYKGFILTPDGNIVLKVKPAQAAERNGIATILPKDISLNASKQFAIGSLNAPLTLYEYSSLGCPHCADFHKEIIPLLKRDYVEKDLLRIVFVNFPLDKKSMKAAMISFCMTNDKYHDFIDLMFSKQKVWWLANDDDALYDYASQLGLNKDEVTSCMNNDNIAKEIIDDRQQGINQLYMEGTPAFLVNGKDGNEIIYGVPDYNELKKYINSRLDRVKMEQ